MYWTTRARTNRWTDIAFSYRPVPILDATSKILEKAVLNQFSPHLVPLLPPVAVRIRTKKGAPPTSCSKTTLCWGARGNRWSAMEWSIPSPLWRAPGHVARAGPGPGPCVRPAGGGNWRQRQRQHHQRPQNQDWRRAFCPESVDDDFCWVTGKDVASFQGRVEEISTALVSCTANELPPRHQRELDKDPVLEWAPWETTN